MIGDIGDCDSRKRIKRAAMMWLHLIRKWLDVEQPIASIPFDCP
jgi:hypothetical protein